VKDELCRELPTDVSEKNVNKDRLQSDMQVAEIRIAELQTEVEFQYLKFNHNLCEAFYSSLLCFFYWNY